MSVVDTMKIARNIEQENHVDRFCLFEYFSPKDIANIKNEIEKRQKETDGQVELPPASMEDIEKIIEPVTTNETEKLPPNPTVTAPIIQKTEITAS